MKTPGRTQREASRPAERSVGRGEAPARREKPVEVREGLAPNGMRIRRG
jgi:hypothetical protein